MLSAPAGSVVRTRVATPPAFSVAVPTDPLASEKVTMPVGVPSLLVTVAVKVTVAPWGTLVGDAVSVVVVDAPVIVSVTGAEVEAA